MSKIALTILTFCLSLQSFAADSFESHFAAGLQSYSAKKYDEALDHFSKARTERPKDPAVLMNLSLVHSQKGELGKAIGFARQSVYLDPLDQLNQRTLSQLIARLEVKEIPHEIDLLEQLEQGGFFKIPALLWQALALTFLVLSLAGFRSHHRKKKEDEDAGRTTRRLPILPTVNSIAWLLFLAFSLGHWYQFNDRRATIIDKKVSLLSAPSLEASLINEVSEGLEVRVLQQKDEWIQVKYPGTLAGWVQKKSLLFAY